MERNLSTLLLKCAEVVSGKSFAYGILRLSPDNSSPANALRFTSIGPPS